MKTLINDCLPLKGYTAMTVWPMVFVRRDRLNAYDCKAERHEGIHGRQQVETLISGAVLALIMLSTGCGWWSILPLLSFWVLYGLFYLIGLACYRSHDRAYMNNPMEHEAYCHQEEDDYLDGRRIFAWLLYVGRKLV